VVSRVHDAVSKTLAAADLRERMRSAGAVPAGNTPEQFAGQIRAEVERHRKVAAERGIRIE